jgi:hypothetical protein
MSYKDLENYIPVISASGACGKFISAMITYALNDIQIEEKKFNFTYDRRTHYHNEWNDIMNETNIHHSSPIEYPHWNKFKLKKDSRYHSLSFAGGITLIDPNDISKAFPNFKIVIITVSPEDRMLIDLNHFWKSGASNYWQEDSEYDFYQSGWQENLTPEIARKIIEEYYVKTGIDTFGTVTDNLAKKWTNQLEPHWQDRIYFIRFRNIVENPETVISTIEQIAEKPLSTDLQKEYYRYVNIQLEYYKNYIPNHPSLLQTSKLNHYSS